MTTDPLTDEALRLAALHRYRVLDTAPEPEFDALARVAALICDVPISWVSFIDETRQWFKARQGFEAVETSREWAFCAYAIANPYDVFEVADASAEARFADAPFVTGSPHIRFYAGVPLVTPDGYVLGTLCVIDHAPRHLTPDQREALQVLARQAVNQLELRLALAGREQAETLLHAFLDNSPTASWITDAEGRITFLSGSYERAFGISPADGVGKYVSDLFPPGQVVDYLANIRRVAETGETVKAIEAARRADGTQGEFLVYKFALPGSDGAVLVGGTAVDVTEQRQANERLRLLGQAVEQGYEAITITSAELDSPGPEIVFVNPAFTRITGYLAEEVIGKTPRLLQGAETDRNLLDTLRQMLEQGRDFAGETTNYRKDGSPFRMEWEISPVRQESGAITHFVATQRDVTERAQMLAFQRSQFERLAALRAIDISIIMNMDVQAILGLILDQMISLLGVDAADALVRNRETNSLEYAARRGFHSTFVRPARTAESEIPLELAVLHKRLITLADLPDGGAALLTTLAVAGEALVDYYAIPLIAKGVVGGVIQLYLRTVQSADQSWMEFLETLAGQAAIAIDNANLFNQLERLNDELVVSHDATIEGWSRALDLRDRETEGHSRRVTTMSLRLAMAMGIKEEALVQIRRGALLHDVGKLGIPDGILLKPGPLTDEEWDIMKRHPTYAYEMLYPIAFLQSALDIPYCHHEKWDGTGYPNGLAGEQIPLAARIFAVADVHDALHSDRPYRQGWPEARVRDHIASLAGIHFDPQVVAVYLSLPPED
jgi:PAS domain S-box-containing protein